MGSGSFSFTIVLIFASCVLLKVQAYDLLLQNLENTYQCLDVLGAPQNDDATISLWPCTPDAKNHQWQLNLVQAYSISVQHSSKCLTSTSNGLGVTQTTCVERAANLTGDQFWTSTTEQIDGITYYIVKNLKTKTCLTGSTTIPALAGTLTLGSCTPSDANRFYSTVSSGYGPFINKLTQLCVDVNGAQMADGALVDLYACVPFAQNEQWKYTTHQIWQEVVGHSSKCLTVYAGSTAVGAIINQYTCQSHFPLNQLWVEVSEGITNSSNSNWYFRIKNVGSGKCLTPGTSTTLQECGSGNWNQLFTRDNVQATAQNVRIKPKHSSKCLKLTQLSQNDGTGFTQKTCTVLPGTDELWNYVPSTTQPGYIQLKNMFANKCLTVTRVVILDLINQRPCTETLNQLWKVTSWGGLQKYAADSNGPCLDVLSANQADNALLGTSACLSTSASQIFIKD